MSALVSAGRLAAVPARPWRTGRPAAWIGARRTRLRRLDTALLKTGMPDMGALVGHAKLAGNLGLSAALGEQVGGAQPSGLTGGTLILGLGRRVVDIAGPSPSINPAVNPSSRRGGGLRVAVPGPGWASGPGLPRWRTNRMGGPRVDVWEPAADPSGGEAARGGGALPEATEVGGHLRARRSWVWRAMASQVQRSAVLGVRSFGRVQPRVCLNSRKVCSRSNLRRNDCHNGRRRRRWCRCETTTATRARGHGRRAGGRPTSGSACPR
jgi:hypothetical protein